MEKQKDLNNTRLNEGVVLVDKPTGISSHTVVNWARRVSGIRKIGHTGTLDPLATGLLILLVGRKYTRMQQSYLTLEKEYICTAQIGVVTDSYDSDGNIVLLANPEEIGAVSQEDIKSVLPQFTGNISQTVPGFSAVKVGGRKLYALMREAQHSQKDLKEITQKLPTRMVEIYQLELVQFSKGHTSDFTQVRDITGVSKKQVVTFTIRVKCSSGTYIRSLVHDIGQQIGVGATVIALRRTRIGEFTIEQASVCPVLLK